MPWIKWSEEEQLSLTWKFLLGIQLERTYTADKDQNADAALFEYGQNFRLNPQMAWQQTPLFKNCIALLFSFNSDWFV